MDENRIVADGQEKLLSDPATRQRLADAVREIKARYAPEMRAAGLIARIRLWVRMRWEIRAAREKIAPWHGCYFWR